MLPASHYLYFSAAAFALAAYGALSRRNILMVFFCVESMVMAASIAFVALARGPESQMFVLFAWTISAAETIVALAIFLYTMKRAGAVELDKLRRLRW